MPKLVVSCQKTLKLTNVLSTEVPLESLKDLLLIVEQMENYIKSKGFQPIGPLVQHNAISGSGENATIAIQMLRQANGYINHVDKPYAMASVQRIPNCLYVRFRGSQDKLPLAYSKLQLTAYEEDIPLKGDSYSVFLNEDGDTITADIFMPRAD